MNERVIPVAGFLVVRRDPPPKVRGVIVLTEQTRAQTVMTTGTVLAVGPGVWEKLCHEEAAYTSQEAVASQDAVRDSFLIGCKVLFEIFTGNSLEDDRGEKVVVLRAEDVRGVVVEGP